MLQAAKIIGTGLATTGLIGAGVGIGVVFGALILGGLYSLFGFHITRSNNYFSVILCISFSMLLQWENWGNGSPICKEVKVNDKIIR